MFSKLGVVQFGRAECAAACVFLEIDGPNIRNPYGQSTCDERMSGFFTQ